MIWRPFGRSCWPLPGAPKPNASQMTSSIAATNSRGMTEPFTPAGAVSNWSRERPRSAMNSGTQPWHEAQAVSTKPGNSTHRRPLRRLLEDGRFAFRLLAVVPLRRARAGFAFFGGFGLAGFRRGACAPDGGGGSVALLAWPRGTGAGA